MGIGAEKGILTWPGNVLSPTQYKPLMLVLLKGMLSIPKGRLESSSNTQHTELKSEKKSANSGIVLAE
jgi:hypothetical protein